MLRGLNNSGALHIPFQHIMSPAIIILIKKLIVTIIWWNSTRTESSSVVFRAECSVLARSWTTNTRKSINKRTVGLVASTVPQTKLHPLPGMRQTCTRWRAQSAECIVCGDRDMGTELRHRILQVSTLREGEISAFPVGVKNRVVLDQGQEGAAKSAWEASAAPYHFRERQGYPRQLQDLCCCHTY